MSLKAGGSKWQGTSGKVTRKRYQSSGNDRLCLWNSAEADGKIVVKYTNEILLNICKRMSKILELLWKGKAYIRYLKFYKSHLRLIFNKAS